MATRRPSTQINARQKVLLASLQACGDEMSGQQLHRSLEPDQAMGLATVYRNLRQLLSNVNCIFTRSYFRKRKIFS